MRRLQGRKSGRLLALCFSLAVTLIARPVPAATELEPIQVGKPVRIEVFPPEVNLLGVREKMQLVVTGHYQGGQVQDLTRVAEFRSTNQEVAILKGTVVQPVRDGTADILVHVGGQETSVSVEVRGQSERQPVSFQYGTLPALSKQGCNAGACHGSPSGKGGFRLSLRAFDPELDKLTLIHEAFGRRSNPLNPDESLLLLKPLMRVPHGGGMKLRPVDAAYHELRDWIAEGCRLDAKDTPKCTKIQVYPSSGRLLRRPAHTQQLCVLAHFSDGSVRDVTTLAVYSSSDDEVASVEKSGLVVGNNRGEAAMIVRYLEFIESSFITFVRDIKGFEWTEPPVNNYVDTLVDAKLKQLQYLPSSVCSDEEFVRRIYLDVIGLLPTVAQASDFLQNKSADKRAQLVDDLLERPRIRQVLGIEMG